MCRCMRSCYQCPICVAPLSVSTCTAPEDTPKDSAHMTDGFILSCPYCCWTSLELDIVFEKSTDITGQLAQSRRDAFQRGDPHRSSTNHFAALLSFTKAQLTHSDPAADFDVSRGSPLQISRLLRAAGPIKIRKQHGKLPVVREAASVSEGLVIFNACNDENDVIADMGTQDHIPLLSQRLRQPFYAFEPVLHPTPTPLLAKRAKRCRTCTHLLCKPHEKLHSTRYLIRSLALSHIPQLTLAPMHPTSTICTALTPKMATQFLLKVRNPLFKPLKITLATPRIAPGPSQPRVTMLCSQFVVGAEADVWNAALDVAPVQRRVREAEDGAIAEAGKVWESGRNWTTVVMEIVPGPLTASTEEDGAADVLKIPIFVHVEEEGSKTVNAAQNSDSIAESQLLGFWTVINVGRLIQTP